MPLFSIVIANFNHGAFLGDAIQSVLDQSCQDFELIVVDGGSSDESVDVIRQYESRIAWWCSEKDRGQSHAFNKGFAKARGRYLSWLNADDLMLPGALEAVGLAVRENPGCEWLVGDTVFFDEQGRIVRCVVGPKWVEVIARYAQPTVYGPTSFYSRELLDGVNGFDETLHYVMDTDLWERFVASGARYIRVRHFCWAFRFHSGSKTSHAIEGKLNKGYAAEQERLVQKRKRKLLTRVAGAAAFWQKALTTYPVTFLETRRWRGRAIVEFIQMRHKPLASRS